MSDPDRTERLARYTSQWLDHNEGADAVRPWKPFRGTLHGSDEAQVADLQVVDALLAGQSQRAASEREARIRRVVQAIEEPARPARPKAPRRLRAWRTGLAAAASLLIGCGLIWLLSPGQSRASVVLQEIGRVSLEPQDRVYTLEHVTPRLGDRPQREGDLYVRGVEGLVIVCDEAVLGCDSTECWFVPTTGTVVVAENFDWIISSSVHERRELELLKAISIESRRAPLVQLAAVAALMRQAYEVSLENVTNPGGNLTEVLVGRLRLPGASDLPDTIRIWSRADSRIIRRAEFSWDSAEARTSQLVLELTDRGPVPNDWYTHGRHHPPDRPVRNLLRDG
jgi:hypothetical protein